jgi:hypothetical protein
MLRQPLGRAIVGAVVAHPALDARAELRRKAFKQRRQVLRFIPRGD